MGFDQNAVKCVILFLEQDFNNIFFRIAIKAERVPPKFPSGFTRMTRNSNRINKIGLYSSSDNTLLNPTLIVETVPKLWIKSTAKVKVLISTFHKESDRCEISYVMCNRSLCCSCWIRRCWHIRKLMRNSSLNGINILK